MKKIHQFYEPLNTMLLEYLEDNYVHPIDMNMLRNTLTEEYFLEEP